MEGSGNILVDHEDLSEFFGEIGCEAGVPVCDDPCGEPEPSIDIVKVELGNANARDRI